MESLPTVRDTGLPADRIASNRQIRDKVETLVDTLPDRLRLPVTLYYFHGMTYREIAETLDEPISTVNLRVNRALKKLRPLMQRVGLGDAVATLGAIAGSGALARSAGDSSPARSSLRPGPPTSPCREP